VYSSSSQSDLVGGLTDEQLNASLGLIGTPSSIYTLGDLNGSTQPTQSIDYQHLQLNAHYSTGLSSGTSGHSTSPTHYAKSVLHAQPHLDGYTQNAYELQTWPFGYDLNGYGGYGFCSQ
jgi:hypothetical protein